jgi:hypothetical protein
MGIHCIYLYLRRYLRRIILLASGRDAASLQITVLTNLRLASLVCQNGAAFPPTTLWSCSGDTEYMSRHMTTVLFYVRKSIVTNANGSVTVMVPSSPARGLDNLMSSICAAGGHCMPWNGMAPDMKGTEQAKYKLMVFV